MWLSVDRRTQGHSDCVDTFQSYYQQSSSLYSCQHFIVFKSSEYSGVSACVCFECRAVLRSESGVQKWSVSFVEVLNVGECVPLTFESHFCILPECIAQRKLGGYL